VIARPSSTVVLRPPGLGAPGLHDGSPPRVAMRVRLPLARLMPRALLAVPLLVVASRIPAALAGHHLFRQAHVAANIDKFVAEGLSLRPRTYNLDAPLSLFDFPAYQLLVAQICRVGTLPSLPTARAVSGLCLVGLLLAYHRVLCRLRVPLTPAAHALLFFAAAPMVVFYFSAPIVDGLALLGAGVSLWAFTEWEGGGGLPWYELMIGGGVLSTLVKSPVFLGTLVAILFARLRRAGARSLFRLDLAVFVAAIAATLVWFKLYTNAVHGQADFLSSWEQEQYFGPLADRLHPAKWQPIAIGLGTLALNPLTAALVPLGAWGLLRRSGARRSLAAGLLLGSAVTLLVFFSRCRVHSYYLLPFVFPLALAAALGLHRLQALCRVRGLRRLSRLLPTAAIAATLLTGWLGLKTMSTALPWLEARGHFIQGLTDPRDFVVYAVDGQEDNWNPEYLYFARRDGYNLWRGRLNRDALGGLYVAFAGRYRRLFVFSASAEADAALDALGAPAVATDRRRRLYRLEPGWIWPRPAGGPDPRAPSGKVVARR